MALEKKEKAALVKQFGTSEKDTGSVQVQVAILTKRIQELTKHLKALEEVYLSLLVKERNYLPILKEKIEMLI